MPAKAKSKKSVKRAVKRTAPSPTSPVSPPPVESPPPPIVEAPVELAAPVVTVPQPPPPTGQPVENLEQILDSDEKDSSADTKNRVVFTLGIVAALAIIAGSIVVFIIYLGSTKAPQTVVHTVTTPSPTPTPAFLRSSVTFEVINASGVSGAATKGAATLTQAGYTVISVGNGKKQATSSLLLSKNLSSVEVSEILADINSLFSVSSSSGDLTGTSTSARIILGSK